MDIRRRRYLQASAAGIAALAGCGQREREETTTTAATRSPTATETQPGPEEGATSRLDVRVRQEPGNTVYWVLPGERRLSPKVFGSGEDPRFGSALLDYRIEQAKNLPSPLSDAVPELLENLPFLVAAPEGGRESTDGEVAAQKLTEPTLYSDRAEITSGEFDVTYRDRQPYDLPGPPGETTDTAELTTRFTDPAENEYELVFDHCVQPPIPGYETGGGVLTNSWHHGRTGTGSPLMPRVYTYGAFWGVGNVKIDGEVADENKVMHFMTTQTVRDSDYRLALDEELPLEQGETIAGSVHHTHGVVLPITATEDGPIFEPVETAFELPNGEPQPFIHVMFEQEELVEAPFVGWPGSNETATTTASDVREIVIEGTEWSLDPSEVTVTKGEMVRIVYENVGTVAHNLTIGEFGFKTDTIQGGERTAATLTPDKTGEFAFWCDVAGHRDAGMEGTLIVEE